jgi:AraC-like DNA-binding protein
LGVNANYLSRAVNDGLGQNFSEMINGMRAEAVAAELDREGERTDLLELALEVGFGSKSSFNSAFRARFGVTPSAYRLRGRVRS